LEPFLNVVQIIISIALIVLILLQARGAGLGGIFGGTDSTVYRTRRGVEKTLFNLTIAVAVAFFLVALINVIVTS
jgi:preprotein translocase subunit SecG